MITAEVVDSITKVDNPDSYIRAKAYVGGDVKVRVAFDIPQP
jgi:hypothetical protein